MASYVRIARSRRARPGCPSIQWLPSDSGGRRCYSLTEVERCQRYANSGFLTHHASKFGNGATVAKEFKKIMAARGVTVSVQHIRDANPRELPTADLYVFSSPGGTETAF
jgi:hypothetical protein